MRTFVYLFFIAFIIASAQAQRISKQQATNQFHKYKGLAINVLKKATDQNFFQRNAGQLSSLIPAVSGDLQGFFSRNSRSLSSISRNLLPKVQSCNGDVDRLMRQTKSLCAPLMLTDGMAINKIIRNGKGAMKNMNKQQLIRKALDLANRLS